MIKNCTEILERDFSFKGFLYNFLLYCISIIGPVDQF